MIYLDNSATTKADESVIESFKQVSNKYFGNPSSIHGLGGEVEKLQKKARDQAARLMDVETEEIIFTSGGTEGNNLAIKGIAFQHHKRGKHIITSAIEHASVYDACKSLEKFGFEVTYLPVSKDGVVDINELEAAITDETILITIMHVNNEIGSVQPIFEIGEIAKTHPKLFFHVDAVQAIGKIPLRLKDSGIDLCTFSGHKLNGLKGSGMIYMKKGTDLLPLFHGGNQEFGIRSGTENVAGNVSFVRALRLTKEKEQTKLEYLKKLRNKLWEGLKRMEGVYINSPKAGAPHIMNVSVPGLKPEVVIHALYEDDIVISTQSACSSRQFEESRVLSACGLSDELASSGLRISLSFESDEQEIETFLHVFETTIKHLKEVLE